MKETVTKLKEQRPVEAVKMLVLVLSVVTNSRGSCTTCISSKRRAKEKQMVRFNE